MAPDAKSRRNRRRQRGEGGLYQRCEAQYGCPPMETVIIDGQTEKVRPEHKCRGQWLGTVDLGWVNGKRKRVTVSARTQAKAAQKLRALKDELTRTGGQALDRRLTVQDWLTYWLEEIAPKKPNTQRFHEVNVNRHLIPILGKTRLNQLSSDDVRRLHKEVAAKQWRGKPVSSTTVMHVHGTLRTALDAAVRESPPKVDRNVAALVKPPGRARSDRGALAPSDARQLIHHSCESGDRMWTSWTMALFTGARQGERLGLEWNRVDLDNDLLDLAWGLDELRFRHGCHPAVIPRPDGKPAWSCGMIRAGSCPWRELDAPPDYELRQVDGRLCLVRLKTEASKRIVPIVGPLKVALQMRRDEYLRERDHYDADRGLVWVQRDGRPIVPKEDSAAWKAAAKAAGVPVLDQHAARHTTATLLLDAGVDQRVVQQIVGHSSAATTARYQHVDVEMARRGLAQMADLIGLPELNGGTP